MTDVNCPYCDSGEEINHDDGVGYEEGVTHSQECGQCKKVFAYTTSISYCHEASKADCLNDGNHKYELSSTNPRCFAKMICPDCGDERSPTDDEKILYSIPTIAKYMEEIKNNKR